METLEKQAEKLSKANEQLEQDIEKLKANNTKQEKLLAESKKDNTNEVKNLVKKIAILEKALENKDENESAKKNLENLENEAEKLKKSNSDLMKDNAKLKLKCEEQEILLKKPLNKSTNTQTAKISVCTKSIQIKPVKDGVKAQFSQTLFDMKKIEEVKSTIEKLKTEKDDKIKELEKENIALEQTNKDLKRSLESMGKKNDSTQDKLKKLVILEKTTANNKKELDAKNLELEKLKNENEALRKQKDLSNRATNETPKSSERLNLIDKLIEESERLQKANSLQNKEIDNILESPIPIKIVSESNVHASKSDFTPEDNGLSDLQTKDNESLVTNLIEESERLQKENEKLKIQRRRISSESSSSESEIEKPFKNRLENSF